MADRVNALSDPWAWRSGLGDQPSGAYAQSAPVNFLERTPAQHAQSRGMDPFDLITKHGYSAEQAFGRDPNAAPTFAEQYAEPINKLMLAANFLGPGPKGRIRTIPEAQAVLERAAEMKQYSPGFTWRSLWDRQMKPPGWVESEPFKLNAVTERSRVVDDISPRGIKTAQDSISVRATKKKMNDMTSDDGLPPSVFKYGDTYYVNDGNHRIAAAKALGLDKIKAEIIDLADRPNVNQVPTSQASGSANAAAKPLGADAVAQNASVNSVFDDSLIQILRKYGLAGIMAGSSAATQQQPQQ